MIDAQAVALCIAVGEKSPLEHFVRREAYARYDVGWVECGLFHLGKIVFGVAIELQYPDGDEGVVAMGPDFGEVEGVEGEAFGLLRGHDLHAECPAGEVADSDSAEEVMAGAVGILAVDDGSLGIAQAADPLLRDKVELAPDTLAHSVDERIGVASKAVHVAEAGGDAALAHGNGDLVEAFGQRCPDVPFGSVILSACLWVAVEGVVEIREFQRVANEEDGRVVAHEIPVALLGVELDGKAANVAVGVQVAALARSCGKAGKDGRDFTDLAEDGCGAVGCDIVCNREGAVSAPSLGMHAAFGQDFAVHVSHFFQMPDILQEHGTACSCGQTVGIVGYRRSGGGGEFMGRIHRTGSIVR